jgi:hypothetical protein
MKHGLYENEKDEVEDDIEQSRGNVKWAPAKDLVSSRAKVTLNAWHIQSLGKMAQYLPARIQHLMDNMIPPISILSDGC